MLNDPTTSSASDDPGGETRSDPSKSAQPGHIGRYRVEKLLGQGGFGSVYLARDEQLQRLVAVKVPHHRRLCAPEEAAAYLAEARSAAGLDHPNIVPVYDVGSTDQWPCFIVSKYISGVSLFERIKEGPLSQVEAAELVTTIAEALHHAHRKRLVHRDVKPGNILIDTTGTPFVVDFGLASREENIGKGFRYAGTPAYMSPEQARGEGHRVDGRSDVFSLGVVFYELLTGRRPFDGDSQDELLDQVRTFEPRPPRQHDDGIPRELDRICMKALAKRASERYSTARDLAEDLRHWTGAQGATVRPNSVKTVFPAAPAPGADIFLSHASPDKETAQRLCQIIEEQGVRCWIAPRDVLPGDDYGESIIAAIEGASVTVLLLSSHANASVHVSNEIERATSKRKRVVPVRLEEVLPNKSLELHLSTARWVDASGLGLDQVASQLVQVVKGESSKTATPSRSHSATGALSSHGSRIHIVPKGQRSFDAHDADFFLELLPGPRDREGLPDSMRFWKTRIEEPDADNTFAVGLIYGPSGCGKSSLVKAGLLPRLSGNVIAIYVEATADETEKRLLNGLRKRFPNLPGHLTLKETLAALRRGECVPPGRKVLIVLDQFEQWLHARKDEQNTELVQALRQCDGSRLQCIVMVRDDFWLAVSRFLRELEIRLVEGQNSALADLFDTDHARKVLAAFGRAFGKLPDDAAATGHDSKQFLSQAVSGLAQEGKVNSVRLALFAEMMKGKPWTPASLKEMGGTDGVGVTFLEETFSTATAPPEHRYHQKAARAVLKSLLPESGADIKGHMRSRAELLKASGYGNQLKDFEDMIRILDGEVRLLTPTDPEGKEGGAGEPATQGASESKCYQLTHDYLVPALRDWLTGKQKETRQGRAELLLADRASVWNARPETRQLPSFRQWLNIRLLTRKKAWSPPQQRMMERATRHHMVRAAALALLLTLAAIAGLNIRRQVVEQQRSAQAAALVKRLIVADTAQAPTIIAELAAYRPWADPLLRQENSRAADSSRQKLHTSLALLPQDPGQVDFLYRRLLTAEPSELPVLRDALLPHKAALLDKLWSVVKTPQRGQEATRLRAAAALAKYDPDSGTWAACSPMVVQDLLRENPAFLGQWTDAFRDVRLRLLDPLAVTFRDPNPQRSAERNLATNLLADYAADQPKVLADLLMDADEQQFAVIFPRFKEQAETGLPLLIGQIDQELPVDAKDQAREKRARRQANAAVALLRMNQPAKVWPLLKHGPDPRARSYLVHRLGPLGADPRLIINRLDEETDLSIRRALVLSLGEFGEQELPPEERAALTTKLHDIYRTADDPGLHSAAEWLLRTWQQGPWLKGVTEQSSKDQGQRAAKLNNIARSFARDKTHATPQWYVNGQGQTMVVLPGPVEFLMGSPLTEASRQDNERQHKTRIGRTFALADKSVTVEQYRRFDESYQLPAAFTRMPDLPVTGASWYRAAAYCNWLSQQEGIPADQWCYQIDNGEVSKLKQGYLGLEGYRLPTEAEMEYAMRAGALTSRYYGETDALLSKYAWYANDSEENTWPVGSKKPNDFGFFDIHGNVFSWCQEKYREYPDAKGDETTEDKEDDLSVMPTDGRVLRGGSFNYPASFVRSAVRFNDVPTYRVSRLGVRVARTLRLDRPISAPPSTGEGGD